MLIGASPRTTFPARAEACPPRRLSLEDAFQLTDTNGGGLREQWTFKPKGQGSRVQTPIPTGKDLLLLDERKLKTLDPLTGIVAHSIPYAGEVVPEPLGTLLVGAEEREIVAFDRVSGERAWRVPLPEWGHNVAVCEKEGLVFGGSLGALVAIEGKTGEELWRHEMPGGVSVLGWSTENEVALATVGGYGSSSKKGAFAYDRKGRELWSERGLEQVCMAGQGPVFGLKERAFRWFGASTHTVRALDPRTGKKLWSLPVDGCTNLWSTPGGDLVVGRGKSLELRDGKTGETRWSLELQAPPHWGGPEALRSLAINGEHWVLTEKDGRVFGLNPKNGARTWAAALPELPWVGPLVTWDGNLVTRAGPKIASYRTSAGPTDPAARSRAGVLESEGAVRVGSVRVKKRG